MGICIGIGNYIGKKSAFLTNKDPSNIYYNLITERGSNILTEGYDLILRDLNNIASEDSLIIISEDNKVIIKDEDKLYYPGLIAAWSAKGKTNDDEDRDVLKDLTGNGHDITLNGFAFSEMSGYGGYKYLFNKVYYAASGCSYSQNNSKNNIILNTIGGAFDLRIASTNENQNWDEYKLEITGLSNGDYITFTGYNENTLVELIRISKNGIYTIPQSQKNLDIEGGWATYIKGNVVNPTIITIEILPEYPDALVFDGVNDYGINENMPILTDYTIIAKREPLLYNNRGNLISNVNGIEVGSTYRDEKGIFSFERYFQGFVQETRNMGEYTTIGLIPPGNVVFQNKYTYNGQKNLNYYDKQQSTDYIYIGCKGGRRDFACVAFYSAYLFDRSLDEQEIKAFIRKYIDSEYLLPSEIPTPDCYYDFTNGDNTSETRDTIEDYSGNDAVAHGFAWNEEGSGYKDGALVFDGVDDYVSLDAFDSGFKTVFMVMNIYKNAASVVYHHGIPRIIYSSGYVAFNEQSPRGISYINGKLNNTIKGRDTLNKKICFSHLFSGTLQNNIPIICTDDRQTTFAGLKLYKFLGFKEALTEDQIQYVIKKYNLLDGVDDIEVS